jgi:hypothetical protein
VGYFLEGREVPAYYLLEGREGLLYYLLEGREGLLTLPRTLLVLRVLPRTPLLVIFLPRVFTSDFSILLPLLLRTIILDSSRNKNKVGSKKEEESNKISSITRRLLRVVYFITREGLLRLRGSFKEESYIYSKYYELNIIVFVLVLILELIRTYIIKR